MTPKQAHDNLVAAIAKAPPLLGRFRLKGGERVLLPDKYEFIIEAIELAEAQKSPEQKKLWQVDNPLLLEISQDWEERFGSVAKKLQAGERFAPETIRGSKGKNELDKKLYNVLADGWHHTPIAEPLAPMPDDTF